MEAACGGPKVRTPRIVEPAPQIRRQAARWSHCCIGSNQSLMSKAKSASSRRFVCWNIAAQACVCHGHERGVSSTVVPVAATAKAAVQRSGDGANPNLRRSPPPRTAGLRPNRSSSCRRHAPREEERAKSASLSARESTPAASMVSSGRNSADAGLSRMASAAIAAAPSLAPVRSTMRRARRRCGGNSASD